MKARIRSFAGKPTNGRFNAERSFPKREARCSAHLCLELGNYTNCIEERAKRQWLTIK